MMDAEEVELGNKLVSDWSVVLQSYYKYVTKLVKKIMLNTTRILRIIRILVCT